MDKKEYIIRQLSKTNKKNYENYVITRIWSLLNSLDVKFVCQQYVKRPKGCGLADMYFPQFDYFIEVDEGHHLNQKKADYVRDVDFVSAVGKSITIKRISISDKKIEEINKQIDEVVTEIKLRIKKAKEDKVFVEWDIEKEYSPQTYIAKGYIDVTDNVVFRTIADGCNCFGYHYKGFQRGGAAHLYEKDVILWFPKLYENELWDNSISPDDQLIVEKCKDKNKSAEHVKKLKESVVDKRIVFARVKSNLGDVGYRFKGLYKIDKEKSNDITGTYWDRIATVVKTYK